MATKSAYEQAAQALDATKLAVTMEGAKAFELYQNLLSIEARQPWENISRPKWLNVHGKTSMESRMMKLLPKLRTPSWSASHSTYNRCSDMIQAKSSSTKLPTHWGNPTRFQFICFWCKSNSLIATSKLYHACTTAQARIRLQSKYRPYTTPTSQLTCCTCVYPSGRPSTTWQRKVLQSILGPSCWFLRRLRIMQMEK